MKYTITDEKVIEQLIQKESGHINHVVLPPGDALPAHRANANAHLIIVRGHLMGTIGHQEVDGHKGDILEAKPGDPMVLQAGQAITEFFIIKFDLQKS